MTANEYINLYHESGPSKFYDEILPSLYNGEWTIDFFEWFPCVVLDDEKLDGLTHIVTRNQTFMHVRDEKLRSY